MEAKAGRMAKGRLVLVLWQVLVAWQQWSKEHRREREGIVQRLRQRREEEILQRVRNRRRARLLSTLFSHWKAQLECSSSSSSSSGSSVVCAKPNEEERVVNEAQENEKERHVGAMVAAWRRNRTLRWVWANWRQHAVI